MGDPALLVTLEALERRLFQPEIRSDPERLGELLHPEFSEVGASGKVYTRDEVLAELRDAPAPYSIWAQDFEAQEVASGLVLLRYRSGHMSSDGMLSRHVARSSLWQYIDGAWKLRFHQGTLSEPFEKHTT